MVTSIGFGAAIDAHACVPFINVEVPGVHLLLTY